MTVAFPGFEDFAAQLTIPSKERGLCQLTPLYGTQRYLLEEIRRGLADNIHEFVALKGRQEGITTAMDALDLYYPQIYPGTIGLVVLDDDTNMRFRRLMLRRMLNSLTKPWRFPVNTDNANLLEFVRADSVLMFDAAGLREHGADNMGRSKGLSYLHADEVGSWLNQRMVSALHASLAERNPYRLFVWLSTAKGNNVFKDLWETAQKARAQRAIFIGWWRHEHYTVRPGDPAWDYAEAPPDADEKAWMREVERRYGVTITPGQLGWYRWRLAEEFRGDAAMRAQEHPCLPEDAFQVFGDLFVPKHVIKRLRDDLAADPVLPVGYRYRWGVHLDSSDARRAVADEAPLRVYEEPDPNGVYVVAAHPWGASAPEANANVVQVWRAWPDRLRLVAEYHDEQETLYHVAWVCLHLLGAYRTWVVPYFILEVGMSGLHVLGEIDRISELGYGLSPTAKANHIASLLGSVQYLYRRADSFSGRMARQMKSTAAERARILYALRDELERGHLEIPHAPLVDELEGLRRGEGSDADHIGGGGQTPEARAFTAALAVESWLQQAINDLAGRVAPKVIPMERSIGEEVVGSFLANLTRGKR